LLRKLPEEKKDFKSGHVILKVREHTFADQHRDFNFSTSRGIITKGNQDYQKMLNAISTPTSQPLNKTLQASKNKQKLMLPNVFSSNNDIFDKFQN